jgi:hypothetical protein
MSGKMQLGGPQNLEQRSGDADLVASFLYRGWGFSRAHAFSVAHYPAERLIL